MHINQKTKTTLLLSCLAISMLALSSGCRTGGFPKPDLAKLAFWKSENLAFASKDKGTPPPPARHFDPAPITGEQESEIVDLNQDKLQRKFNNDIEEMRAEISAAAKALGTPIRKPYAADTASTENKFAANTKSSFEAATGNVRSKLDGFGDQAKTNLNAAQNDFQAAMNNTTDALGNQFAASRNAATDMTQGWKDKVSLPGMAQSQNNIDSSLAAVKKSLNNANDKLASNLIPESSSAFKSGIGAFGGSLTPMEIDPADKLNQFSSNTRQNGAEVASNANSFSPMRETPMPKSTSELDRVQAQMAEAKRQIEELKKQVAIASQPNSVAPLAQPITPSNSFGPSIPGSPNNSFGTTPPDSMSTYQSAPVERVAQLQSPSFGSQFAAKAAGQSPPTNQLRSNHPLRPQFPQATPQPSATPAYPSTSHGVYQPRSNDFSGNFSPMQAAPEKNKITAPASQVGFQSANSDSMVVTANNAIPPNAGDTAVKIQNHVSDIDIPESVLKGTGSYAPGSVQPLKADK